jgi:hypothetical protein
VHILHRQSHFDLIQDIVDDKDWNHISKGIAENLLISQHDLADRITLLVYSWNPRCLELQSSPSFAKEKLSD